MFPRRNRPGLISQTTPTEKPAETDQKPSSPNPTTQAPQPGQSPPSTPSPKKSTARYGDFENNSWYCNCNPRGKAVVRRSRQDNVNRDRCFHSCRLGKDQGCGFFLWLEEAEELCEKYGVNGDPDPMSTRKRNQESIRKYLEVRPAIQPSSQEEPDTPTRRPRKRAEGDLTTVPFPLVTPIKPEPEDDDDDNNGIFAVPAGVLLEQRPARPSTPPPRTADPAMPITPANLAASVVTPSRSKRRREEDLDQEPEWQEFSSDEEREFFALADSAVKPTNSSAGPLDPLSSPLVARTLTVDGLSTPVTNEKMAAPPPVPFPAPVPGSLAAKRQRVQPSPYAASSSRLQSAPHLNRGQAPAAPGGQDILGPEEAEITGIMALLKTHNSPPAVCNAVRSTFDRFAMRIASARTEKRLAQAAVEDKDERIARLQAKLRDLENSVREQREARASTRGLLLEMYQNI